MSRWAAEHVAWGGDVTPAAYLIVSAGGHPAYRGNHQGPHPADWPEEYAGAKADEGDEHERHECGAD